jgi:hypothetical protein
MLPEHCQGEATSQVIRRPIKTVLIAQQPEEILSKALLRLGIAFETFEVFEEECWGRD